MIISNKEKMGVTFEGTDGKIYVDRGKLEAEPKSLLDSQIGPVGIHLYESDDHFRNFIDCVISRQPTAAPVEVAHSIDHDLPPGKYRHEIGSRKAALGPAGRADHRRRRSSQDAKPALSSAVGPSSHIIREPRHRC